MRRLIMLLLLLPQLFLPLVAGAAEPLRIGLFPNLSTRALLTMYQPLRQHLEEALGRPVVVETAPDFPAFSQRLLRREYDVAVAAPHLARLGQVDAGYRLLARYEQPIQAYLLMRAGYAPKRGMRVAIPDDTAIVTMLGIEMLAASGMARERDYGLIEAKSHSNAALRVMNGQAEAALVGSLPYVQLPSEVKEKLRVVEKSRPIPSQYFLASPSIPAPEQAAVIRALLAFQDKPAGADFITRYGMGGLAAVKQDELASMDGFVERTRELLRGSGGR